ncbi:MAG TPA: diguanylate cyclase [Candidatus Melainabacteria bacterium]|nr:diguanylate cyclase [Candidatus Melainabacteria bacterium]
MALSQSFKATQTQSIKLAEMNAVPNTEDLRYMLTEATMQRKPVVLPFKNPANGLGFVIKVAPAIGEGGPRWTFERVSGDFPSTLWTRESREVAMIQGKLAIDSIYKGACTDTSQAAAEEVSPRHSGSFPVITTASQENTPVDIGAITVETTPLPAPQFGFLEPPNYNLENSQNWFCSFSPKETQASTLPPPAQFDARLLGQVVAALTDPATYLATYGAFSYFLLRQFAQFQMSESSFAVVVFEITIRQNGVEMMIPKETFKCIAERIRSLMSPLDVAAHVKDGEFAVLLCSSDSADALRFARSLHSTITAQSILPEGIEAQETIVVGAAALPETCQDPGELLAAAREAKEAAVVSDTPYLLYQ